MTSRLPLVVLALLAIVHAAAIGWAQDAPGAANAEARFDRVWRLVDERYWDVDGLEVDWTDVRERFAPRARAATDEAERVRDAYGDLPCIGVFSQADAGDRSSGPVGWRLERGLGVIRVEDLARAGTSSGVRAAVTDLERRGARALALDLRGNPGGRLVEMMTTAGVFVRGLLWRVATRWSLPIPYPALGVPATDLPVAVLVDGRVASAAEGLAGALQASGRAVVVGERTSGNVEAVLPFCLRDGAQVWLATGVLAPIGGPTWEGRGVAPDVVSEPGDAEKAAREALLGRE